MLQRFVMLFALCVLADRANSESEKTGSFESSRNGCFSLNVFNKDYVIPCGFSLRYSDKDVIEINNFFDTSWSDRTSEYHPVSIRLGKKDEYFEKYAATREAKLQKCQELNFLSISGVGTPEFYVAILYDDNSYMSVASKNMSAVSDIVQCN